MDDEKKEVGKVEDKDKLDNEKAAVEDAQTQKDLDRSLDMVDRANEAADRLENANKDLKVTLERQERLRVETVLGGKSEAGSKDESEEEKAIASARKLVEGSGFEDSLFPKKK